MPPNDTKRPTHEFSKLTGSGHTRFRFLEGGCGKSEEWTVPDEWEIPHESTCAPFSPIGRYGVVGLAASAFSHSAAFRRKFSFTENYRDYKAKDTWLSKVAYGHAHRPKLLTYDLEKLVKLGALRTMFTYGTLFMVDKSLIRQCFIYLILGFGTTLAVLNVFDLAYDQNEIDTEDLEQLSFYLNRFIHKARCHLDAI